MSYSHVSKTKEVICSGRGEIAKQESRSGITPARTLLEEQGFDLYCVSVGLVQQDFDVVIGGRQGVMSQLLLDILDARSSFEPRKGSRVTCGMHFRGSQVLLTDIGDSLITQSVASISG